VKCIRGGPDVCGDCAGRGNSDGSGKEGVPVSLSSNMSSTVSKSLPLLLLVSAVMSWSGMVELMEDADRETFKHLVKGIYAPLSDSSDNRKHHNNENELLNGNDNHFAGKRQDIPPSPSSTSSPSSSSAFAKSPSCTCSSPPRTCSVR